MNFETKYRSVVQYPASDMIVFLLRVMSELELIHF